MNYQNIITLKTGKRGGKPCIRGMRITVYDVLKYLARAWAKTKYWKISPISPKQTSSLVFGLLLNANVSLTVTVQPWNFSCSIKTFPLA